MSNDFWELIEPSLVFRLLASDVTRVPPHTEEPWRTLPCNVLVQNQGDAMSVEFQDAPPLSIPSGCGFFVSTNRTHYIRSDSPHWRVSRWAHLAYTVFEAVDLFELLPVGVYIPAKQADALGDRCAAFAQLQGEPAGLRRSAMIQHIGYEVLAILSGVAAIQAPSLDHLRRFHQLAPVLGTMTRACDQPFTIHQLCKDTRLSPSRLHALFREVTGLAPMKYLQRIRLSRAQYLLTVTNMKVADIGASVGYPDPYHFSRLFRKLVGVSPLTYRKHVTKGVSQD